MQGYIFTSKFSSDSEVFASESLENIEERFPQYYMHIISLGGSVHNSVQPIAIGLGYLFLNIVVIHCPCQFYHMQSFMNREINLQHLDNNYNLKKYIFKALL